MTPKERIHVHTFAVTLLFILGATGIFIFNGTITATGYATYDSLSSTCKEYFGDNLCDDSPADCGSYYKSGTSLDACDECQTYKNGKPGFDNCVGAGNNVLLEGETQVYPLAGKDYEVTLDFVSSTVAKFSVNGMSTPQLQVGKPYTLVNGVTISVDSIYYKGDVGGKRSATFSLTILSVPGQVTEPGLEGDVKDSLNKGETKIYTINNKDYDVTLNYVSSTAAKFSVNGESTSSISIGKSFKLADGTEIAVNDILYQDFPGGIKQVELVLKTLTISKETPTTTSSTPLQKNSCKDSCGSKSKTGTCWCDSICSNQVPPDCCLDISTYCPEIVSSQTLTSANAAQTLTPTDQCKDYFGDQLCDDSLADCGSSYKSGTSLDACDECQTTKDGKLGFGKCVGAAPVQEKPNLVISSIKIIPIYYYSAAVVVKKTGVYGGRKYIAWAPFFVLVYELNEDGSIIKTSEGYDQRITFFDISFEVSNTGVPTTEQFKYEVQKLKKDSSGWDVLKSGNIVLTEPKATISREIEDYYLNIGVNKLRVVIDTKNKINELNENDNFYLFEIPPIKEIP